jgi:hypothetical protein
MTELVIKEDEIKERHLKRLFYLSHKSVGQTPQLEEPDYEQKQWFVRRMRGRARSWEVWDE